LDRFGREVVRILINLKMKAYKFPLAHWSWICYNADRAQGLFGQAACVPGRGLNREPIGMFPMAVETMAFPAEVVLFGMPFF
jgi:hypothetical protein